MNHDEYEAMVENIHKLCVNVSGKKRHDYASDVDVLSNFNEIAVISDCMQIDVRTHSALPYFMNYINCTENGICIGRESNQRMNQY